MNNHDPEIIIFKPGYKYRVLVNEWVSSDIKDYQAVRYSDWNGKLITLKKFSGSRQEYAEMIHDLDNKTDFARTYDKNCAWKNIPVLLSTIENIGNEIENENIKLKGWRVGARIRKADDVANYKKCISDVE